MRLISKKTLLLFFLPGAIFMGAFLIYPIMKMVFDSFFKVGITGDRAFIGLDNYIKAFTAITNATVSTLYKYGNLICLNNLQPYAPSILAASTMLPSKP